MTHSRKNAAQLRHGRLAGIGQYHGQTAEIAAGGVEVSEVTDQALDLTQGTDPVPAHMQQLQLHEAAQERRQHIEGIVV